MDGQQLQRIEESFFGQKTVLLPAFCFSYKIKISGGNSSSYCMVDYAAAGVGA
jgi:hypothetical protein